VLRDSRYGRRMHRAYVWVKIPLAVLAGIATWWLWSELVSNPTKSAPGAPPAGFTAGVSTAVLIGVVLSLLYPIVLAGVIRMRAVREFYQNAHMSTRASAYF